MAQRFRMNRIVACTAALLGAAPMMAQACSSEPYAGTICTFAMNWCPQGFLPADGRQLSVQQNQVLFAVLGFQYGGDNQNNFNLPDLRGRVAVGTGQGGGLTVPVTQAQKIGQQQLLLTAAQAPLQAHTHGATFAATTGPATLNIPATTGSLNVTAALPVSPSVGSVSGTVVALGAGQNGYLAAIKGTTGVDDVTFSGPYTASAPASPAYLQANVQVTGSPATAAASVPVTMINGGSVTVAQAGQAATQAVSTQSPALGMSVCIVTTGLFPSRP